MNDYTPDLGTVRYRYVEGDYSGGNRNPHDEFDRFIAKVKADAKREGQAEAWSEGYEAGCSSLYGTATPSGKPYDPEPNPYRIEEDA